VLLATSPHGRLAPDRHRPKFDRELRASNERLCKAACRRSQIVGDSAAVRTVMTEIEKVAPVPRPVLVLSPRGMGKELVARAIHASEPFITINCAAVAEILLESELFGHEEGAFTGALGKGLHCANGHFQAGEGAASPVPLHIRSTRCRASST
jgi:transcriptional regulator with GAF, ATPase, and Fis domain